MNIQGVSEKTPFKDFLPYNLNKYLKMCPSK